MNKLTSVMSTDASIKRLSANKISEMTGLDHKTVSSILNGESDNPKLQTLQMIAECLGGSIEYMTEDSRHSIKTGDICYYRTMIASMENDIKNKTKWIKILVIICLALIGVMFVQSIVALLIIGI